ncbi:MAG: SGNH/GDSL hydrolase family protein [Clostridia bacterium]|nr:SGNH/GDSL hydrolase family protein [Clostridia bacterium]
MRYDYSKYSVEAYTAPVWKGDRVGNESVMFLGDEGVSLLYNEVQIEGVYSFDLKTKYAPSEYFFRGGKLYRSEHSSMPRLTWEEYYPLLESERTKRRLGGGNLLFSEGSFFSDRQVVVTYTHADPWRGFIPNGQRQKAEKLLRLISSNQPITIAFFGDSITAGSNASGYLGFSPYAARYSEQVANYLKRKFGNDRIESYNFAVGGKTSAWGIGSAKSALDTVKPDLAVVAFGMNDGGLTAARYLENIRKIVDLIVEKNAQATVVLVSPMAPNPQALDFYKNQPTFEKALLAFSEESGLKNIAVAPMTSMHESLLKRKKYADMTGNNINHPNDFLTRIYAQVILKTLLGDEFTELQQGE